MSSVVTFEDSVKARIKSIVADLIPEDRWEAIVRSTVSSFEKDDLPKLIKSMMAEEYKKLVAAEFAKPEWQQNWGDPAGPVSDAVKKMLVDSAPLILASMLSNTAQSIVDSLRYSMQNVR